MKWELFLLFTYYVLPNRALALPRKLIKQYKGTHLDILY